MATYRPVMVNGKVMSALPDKYVEVKLALTSDKTRIIRRESIPTSRFPWSDGSMSAGFGFDVIPASLFGQTVKVNIGIPAVNGKQQTKGHEAFPLRRAEKGENYTIVLSQTESDLLGEDYTITVGLVYDGNVIDLPMVKDVQAEGKLTGYRARLSARGLTAFGVVFSAGATIADKDYATRTTVTVKPVEAKPDTDVTHEEKQTADVLVSEMVNA